MSSPKLIRYRSGTAQWHMSKRAVDRAVPDVLKWSEDDCIEYIIKVRFGSRKTVACAHCNTICDHYWRPLEKRWKCKCCGKTFSVTSGTVYANHRKPLQLILVTVLMWINGAAGKPALELKRHFNMSYNTCYVWPQKMREALVRGFNVGLLSGDMEMDGAHQSGYRANEKRGVPQGAQRIASGASVTDIKSAARLTQTGNATANKKGRGAVNPEFGNRLPKNRRLLLAVCKRSGLKGKGACNTRVAVGIAETPPIVEAVAKSFIAKAESYLNTDSSPAYTSLGKNFKAHRTVEHSKMLSGPNGENNNQVEELNGRYDRLEKGTYLNIEPKYLLDYAVETAFRSDTRRISNGQQMDLAMHLAMNVGHSIFWRGFTHGTHRDFELSHPLPMPARSSGPKKGRKPGANLFNRLPR